MSWICPGTCCTAGPINTWVTCSARTGPSSRPAWCASPPVCCSDLVAGLVVGLVVGGGWGSGGWVWCPWAGVGGSINIWYLRAPKIGRITCREDLGATICGESHICPGNERMLKWFDLCGCCRFWSGYNGGNSNRTSMACVNGTAPAAVAALP